MEPTEVMNKIPRVGMCDTLVTPEVMADDKILYLIRMNGEEQAFTDTEREAVLVVDSLSAAKEKDLRNEWTKVYRQDLEEGKRTVISIQTLGYLINGGVSKTCVIDCIPVRHCFPIKGRHELKDEGDKTSAKIPLPEVLQKMVLKTIEEDDSDLPEDGLEDNDEE